MVLTSMGTMSSSTKMSSTPLAEHSSAKRVLCLHGRCQSGKILSNKIAGARKKLQRVYELDFLDGPVVISSGIDGETEVSPNEMEPLRAWWERDENGKHVSIEKAFDYVMEATKGKRYDAILGFSQGGLLGAALVQTDEFANVKAVLTAGSPYVEDVFGYTRRIAPSKEAVLKGKQIPKLHFAGETDPIVSVESTRRLSEEAGRGVVIMHNKGHLFPTKAAHVNEMLEFLKNALEEVETRE